MSEPRLRLVQRLRELYVDGGWTSLRACAQETGHARRAVGRYLSGAALPPMAFVDALLTASAARAGYGVDSKTRLAARELYCASVQDAARRPQGPWDISEVDNPWHERIDLGALFVASYGDGMELSLQREEDGERRWVGATVVLDRGAAVLQITAFAVVAGEPLWEDVRADMSEGLTADGSFVTEEDGPFGTELSVAVPDEQMSGGYSLVRFAGCDGPGWLLRGTFEEGAALSGTRYARPMDAVFSSTVVAPGHEVHSSGDPLCLTPPP
ncbi:DUF3710 domain-containing protein [Streptomyces iconiensis]|uniref:DUF3710 domain-containing protein n=1 Tax=Streptomyces iconiensis TaxID=1384038 RepID=A0ABT6ZQ80_9ACTN|nr:DUF3710 domain-containing protein [Streptomyces iconiensis]MDJ1131189.1 DUF3710 domain-containing protein [Streptomyces iconiensis]